MRGVEAYRYRDHNFNVYVNVPMFGIHFGGVFACRWWDQKFGANVFYNRRIRSGGAQLALGPLRLTVGFNRLGYV